MAKKTYKALGPLHFDGKDVRPGDTFEADAAEIEGMDVVEVGVQSLTEAERIAAIAEAIGKLDKADASLWTAGGAPKTEAIAAITGWAVKAAERDAALATLG